MPKFNVQVARTGFAHQTISVEATNGGQAALQALLLAGDNEFTENNSEYAVLSVTDSEGQSVSYEESPSQDQVWVCVTGRIPGDDEDSYRIYQLPENVTRAEIFDLFERDMYEDEVNAEETMDANEREHGQSLFINTIVISASEIREFE